MEKFYVSGSTSFIALYVQRALIDFGYELILLDRTFVDYPEKCLANEKFLVGSTLLYFGWYSNKNEDYKYSDLNYLWLERATKAINYAQIRGMKIVIPGSCAEYLTSNDFPYVQSKRSLLDRLKNSQIDYLWPRIFYTFSCEEQRPRILRLANNSYLSGQTLTLKSAQDAQDYIEVRDVALQITKALQLKMSGEIDIGTGIINKTYNLINKTYPKLNITFAEATSPFENKNTTLRAKVNSKLFEYKNSYTFRYFEGE